MTFCGDREGQLCSAPSSSVDGSRVFALPIGDENRPSAYSRIPLTTKSYTWRRLPGVHGGNGFTLVAQKGDPTTGDLPAELLRDAPDLACGFLTDLAANPESLLEGAVILDEVQRCPDLLVALKRSVDEQRRPGRFILSGSANLALLGHVSETLAGCASYFTLHPMTRREQRGTMAQLAALRTAQVLVISTLARDAKLNAVTAGRYLDLLEAHVPEAQMGYWHEQGRHEVDFVIEVGRKVFAIEVKAATRWSESDLSCLRAFLERTPACVAAVLAHNGKEAVKLGERLFAIPLGKLLEQTKCQLHEDDSAAASGGRLQRRDLLPQGEILENQFLLGSTDCSEQADEHGEEEDEGVPHNERNLTTRCFCCN